MKKFALFGAAGVMGNSVAKALEAAQLQFRVVGRSREKLEKCFKDNPYAEITLWDPDSPLSIRKAAENIHTLIYMVGVDYWKFELHPVLMHKTLEAAIAAGVENIVLIGTVYPYGMPRIPVVTENHPRVPCSFKGEKRKEQEDMLMASHRDGLINATVLRLPDFYGPGVDKSFLHNAIQAGITGKTADMIGPINLPHEFVFVPDVGPVVVKLAQTKAAYGNFWQLAGAGVTTQKEIVEHIELCTGRRLRLRIAGKTLLRILGLFNSFLRELVEMHYLLTHPILMDDSALQELIGPIQKTSYQEGILRCLEDGGFQPQARAKSMQAQE
ncbi:NAD-dependent epimerase/dehydratase family protein [Exilibacterium tricleocarpae]|uniref:NAD-dependent epimerase/dehydratase family protein n=1 Tax=Exilibacterium tricleocarpae TaxID=2591008 RepID=A0A545TAD9_9GAMM|nr:NAD-dependent epimerase/dehydratase family protein [Exilibacterium tricleocarpae]TQV74164.1 NAD-dependent epimerase/dehydratase family protein [Exilibacterium tricleocarpae]